MDDQSEAKGEHQACLEGYDGSSSDDEDQWIDSHSYRTHSLLSAEQLELWREVLREEIEEDLQRQVRDRLGLDLFCRPAQATTTNEIQKDGLMIFRPSRHHRAQAVPNHNSSQPTPHSTDIPHTPPQPQPEVGVADQQHRVKFRQERKSLQRSHTTVEPVLAETASSQPPTKGHMADHMTLQQYMNTKYGVPKEQLAHLSASGVFQTQTLDTSGCGHGQVIHFPTEANIVLPTPTHVTLTTPTVSAGPGDPSSHLPTDQRPGKTVPHSTTTQASTTSPSNTGPMGTTSSKRDPVLSSSETTVVYSSEAGPSSSNSALRFEARFEGGNLQRAAQIGPFEYNLWLNFDLFSAKHTQWFYFQVEGMVAMTTYVFHIVNLYKPDSLYNYGMQPLLYSTCEERLGKGGWARVGTNVSYTPTPSTKYYTLTWNMVFPHTEDLCYLAHCYPYPYSKLLSLLDCMEACPQRGRHIRRESLCKTLAGNDCPLITVTDFEAPPLEVADRQGIVVSARVHPGETNSSWMMEGLLGMLTGDTSHAKALRSRFVFKLVPMLNPDGVVVGNYRTSLAGVDLNRVYKNTVPELFPTVAHIKAMVDSLMAERKVVLYVDLHGHSRKHNVFMYGCHAPQSDHSQFLKERVFPYLLSQQAPQMFSYPSCKFGIQRCKESTGRVVMWRRGVANAFTMEATFCGSTLGHNPQFTAEDLVEMGQLLGEAVYTYHRLNCSKSYEQKVLGQLADMLMRSAGPSLPDLVPTQDHQEEGGRKRSTRKALRRFMKFDLSQMGESSTSGSDSENDEFEYRRKKTTRVKKAKHKPSLHTRTQPLLPMLPSQHSQSSQSSQPSQTSRQAQPSQRHKYIPSVRSCAPLPPLTRFSAPPRLTGGDKSHSYGWRFVDKYKGRSNGGIPMFSEERLRERAEKRLRSKSMFQPLTSEQPTEEKSEILKRVHRRDPHTHVHTQKGNCESKRSQRHHKHKLATSFLWQHTIGEDLERARVQGSVETTTGRQQRSDHTVARQRDHPRPSIEGGISLRQYNSLRHMLTRQTRGGQSSLPPALAQYIRELWSKN